MNDGVRDVTKDLVTVGQIASIAGVGPSAVSNWRNRYSDFPVPVEETSAGDLFDLETVIAWLKKSGKEVNRPTVDWAHRVWSATDLMRGRATLDDSVLFLLQLLYVYAHTAERTDGVVWPDVSHVDRLHFDHWPSQFRASVVDPELTRVMQPPSSINGRHLHEARIAFGEAQPPKDGWGALATLLLNRYQEARGAGGTARTPPSVTALQVELLKPILGAVYDPACGAAMVLAESWRARHGSNVVLYGQEVNEFNWRLGYLHLALNDAPFELRTGDTLLDDRFRSLRAQRIAVDPPFGMRMRADEIQQDERWKLGVPRGSADWLWPQLAAYHLAEDGLAVVTLVQGALSRGGYDEHIRRELVEANILDAVVELPPGLFPGTSVQAALLVMNKNRGGSSREILFIDAKQLGQPRRGRLHELEDEDVHRVADTVARWRSGSFEGEVQFSATASTDTVLANRADLSPRRYVRYSARVTEIDGEGVPERLRRLRIRAEKLVPAATVLANEALADLRLFTAGNEWAAPSVRLGDLLESTPRTGTRHVEEGSGRGVPFVGTRAVTAGGGRIENVPDELTHAQTRGRTVERGDVLLAARGIDLDRRIGCAVVAFDGTAAYSDSLLRLSPDPERLDPDYLRLFLTSHQGRSALTAATTGSVIANLRGEALQEIHIPLPSLAAQKAIVRSVQKVEAAAVDLAELSTVLNHAFDTAREGFISGLYKP